MPPSPVNVSILYMYIVYHVSLYNKHFWGTDTQLNVVMSLVYRQSIHTHTHRDNIIHMCMCTHSLAHMCTHTRACTCTHYHSVYENVLWVLTQQ